MSIIERSPDIDSHIEKEPCESDLFETINKRFDQAVADGRADLISSDGKDEFSSKVLRLRHPDDSSLKLYLTKAGFTEDLATLQVEYHKSDLLQYGLRDMSTINPMDTYAFFKEHDEVQLFESIANDDNSSIEIKTEVDSVALDTSYLKPVNSYTQHDLLDLVQRATYPPEEETYEIAA